MKIYVGTAYGIDVVKNAIKVEKYNHYYGVGRFGNEKQLYFPISPILRGDQRAILLLTTRIKLLYFNIPVLMQLVKNVQTRMTQMPLVVKYRIQQMENDNNSNICIINSYMYVYIIYIYFFFFQTNAKRWTTRKYFII